MVGEMAVKNDNAPIIIIKRKKVVKGGGIMVEHGKLPTPILSRQ